jgi:hypothetical protein
MRTEAPHVHAGERHLRPTPPRATRTEAPAFTRGSVTFTLRHPSPCAQKPPRSRGGVSPSPYVTPRHAHRSPRVHAAECHLPPTSPLAMRTEAPAFTRGSVTFPLRHPSPRAQKPPRSRGGVSPSPYVTPRKGICRHPDSRPSDFRPSSTSVMSASGLRSHAGRAAAGSENQRVP